MYSANIHSKVDELLEEHGIEGWFFLIPYLHDYYFDSLNEEQKIALDKWIFNQPQKGIDFFKEHDVLTMIQIHMPDRLEYIQSLYDYWSEGYYLIFDY